MTVYNELLLSFMTVATATRTNVNLTDNDGLLIYNGFLDPYKMLEWSIESEKTYRVTSVYPVQVNKLYSTMHVKGSLICGMSAF